MIETYGMGFKFTCFGCGYEFMASGDDIKKWNFCPCCGRPLDEGNADNPYTADEKDPTKLRNDILDTIETYRDQIIAHNQEMYPNLEDQFNVSSVMVNLSQTYKNLKGD